MNRTLPRLLFLFLAAQLTSAAAVDVSDTRLLKSPSISARHIAFAYDSDIWVAGRDGGAARRVTSAEGVELNPVLSPDGRWLAFTGNYDGNMDAYVMPAGGGEVRRLTWHPGNDMVVGFSGDSQRVLFYTPRSVHTNRHRHLYTVSVAGGPAERLPVPTGIRAALSPDGTRIAYTPHAPAFLQWKHYRGGRISRIWIMHLDDYDVIEVPMPDGGANNTDPMWIGDTLYFVSDRDGEFNLYRYADGAVVRLTEFDDFPVMNAKAGDGVIVFERAGQLHTFNPADGMVTTLAISAPSDLREARPRWVSGAEWVRSGHLAPDGNRVALEFRGEIVTVPADKGTPDVLSQSPGVHDRSPVWSPDGAEIAWFADEGGEYGLHVRQLETSETRRFEIEGAGFYFDPQWSPDSRYLAFRDNALALFLFDRESGRSTRIAAEPVYGPVITMTYRFSPDSRWLAYTLNTEGLTQAVHLHDLKSGRSRQITDGFAEVSEPTFGPDGDYLYMLASTEAGPVKDWFAQSNIDMMIQHHVYVATLAADGPDPLPPQEDEVAIQSEEAEDDAGADEEAEQKPTRVDFDGLDRRIRALPVPAATRHSLAVGEAGALFWIETKERTSFDAFNGPGELKRFTLKDREAKTVLGDVSAFELSADGKKILYLKQGKWFVTDAGEKLEEGKGQLKLDAVRVRIDPRAEWQQMFDEAWRINRDYFYADNYHGADWDAVKARYAPLVAHAATSADVMQLIRWMASELAVGHSYLGLGDTIEDPEEVSVGLLGADFVLDADGYRFERIYGGLNWAPELQAPLARPGVNVQEGDYLLAVDGEPVTINRSVFSYFENTVDRPVTLTVAASPRAASRSVEVVPTGSETQLRLRAWVKDNRQKVHEATDGRVAYVYVPNTTVAGHTYFKRDYYPQSHLPGIIVDERYNGGGLFADYYIDILRRPFAAWWAMRYGADLKSPRAATFGPKVMIADENAGSGGDLLPWMFKKYNLGPVVGTRTWGGLVGILGFPVLMDGGTVTAPNLAIWNDDGWIVENVGVPPDVEVRQWPKAVNAGGDPQLEKAIELALDGLKAVEENPPARPPFPTRALGPQQ
ncbi:MAG: PDZ domain-containing protein [Pseudomonadota bacterium]